MANFSSFFPTAGGGASSTSNTVFLLGTTSDQTDTFSPTDNNLEVGSIIHVTLIGGGTGGTAKGSGGAPNTSSGLGGAAGGFWSGYYKLTSTSDITLTAGRGGAGGSQSYTSGQSFTATGTSGNHSTLSQGGSVILSSDSTVTTTMVSPSWAALTASGNDADKFLGSNSTSLSISGHGSASSHSPLDARQGSGSGGGGILIGTYGYSGTLTAGDGGAGYVIINF